MKIIDVKQGSPEWLAARAGTLTGTGISRMMSTSKGDGRTRRSYLEQLVMERVTGKPILPAMISEDMKHGNLYEPVARMKYCSETGREVKEVGMILHPFLERAASSPDGLVDPFGCIEIKCPRPENYQKYKDGHLPRNYLLQMQWLMICAERLWCDFVAYNAEKDELFIRRVNSDGELANQINVEAKKFLQEIEERFKLELGKPKQAKFTNSFGFQEGTNGPRNLQPHNETLPGIPEGGPETC